MSTKLGGRHPPVKMRVLQDGITGRSPASRYGGPLKAVNADGYYRVENDTFGDEDKRARHFDACLMHPPRVLCASGLAGDLAHPKQDLVPYMLKLLQTVEFLEP